MPLFGYATPEATSAYFERFPTIGQRQLDRRSRLTVSQAGFGSYRIDSQNDAQRQALRQALSAGINLIDTSSNYSDGRSEQLIGEVLTELVAQEVLKREEVVVISKVGYLQGENYAISQQRKQAGNPFPELVEYAQGLEHCIHPEFIADQLTRSLERLQLERLDGYLLHNPEYYLGWAKKIDMPLAEARAEYYRRLQQAFAYLEEEVAAGRISWYGVSSNSFPKGRDAYDFTSLEQILSLLPEKAHFALIQLPMNLVEPEAAFVAHTDNGRSILELAAAEGLGVLINRPLNGVVGNSLIRLAELPAPRRIPDEAEVNAAVRQLVEEESRLQRVIFNIDIPFRTKQEFAATMAAGRLLEQRWHGFGSYNNWLDVMNGYIRPRSRFGIDFLNRRPEFPQEGQVWIEGYVEALRIALQRITAVYQAEAVDQVAQIAENAATVEPEWQAETLSQTAVRALRGTQGVSCVLVGMREPQYVADVVAGLEEPIAAQPRREAWEQLATAVEVT